MSTVEYAAAQPCRSPPFASNVFSSGPLGYNVSSINTGGRLGGSFRVSPVMLRQHRVKYASCPETRRSKETWRFRDPRAPRNATLNTSSGIDFLCAGVYSLETRDTAAFGAGKRFTWTADGGNGTYRLLDAKPCKGNPFLPWSDAFDASG